MDHFIAGRDWNFPVSPKRASIVQTTLATVIRIIWLTQIPNHAIFCDMRPGDADSHQVAYFRITQHDIRQFVALRCGAQDDPDFEIGRLHQSNFRGQTHDVDLLDLDDFASKRPGIRRCEGQSLKEQRYREEYGMNGRHDGFPGGGVERSAPPLECVRLLLSRGGCVRQHWCNESELLLGLAFAVRIDQHGVGTRNKCANAEFLAIAFGRIAAVTGVAHLDIVGVDADRLTAHGRVDLNLVAGEATQHTEGRRLVIQHPDLGDVCQTNNARVGCESSRDEQAGQKRHQPQDNEKLFA